MPTKPSVVGDSETRRNMRNIISEPPYFLPLIEIADDDLCRAILCKHAHLSCCGLIYSRSTSALFIQKAKLLYLTTVCLKQNPTLTLCSNAISGLK